MKRVLAGISLFFIITLIISGCNKGETEQKKVGGIDKIKQTKVIRIALDKSDYPPFSIFTESDPVGFDIDIAYDIARKMGVKAEFVKMDFDSILTAVDNGEIDLGLATFTITPERNLITMFSQPYIVTGQAVLMDKSLKNSVYSFRDLNTTQYKIVYTKGNTSENAVKKLMPDSRYFGVDTPDEALNALKTKQAHAMVADMPFCSTQSAKDAGENFHFIDEPITFEPIGIAVNKEDYHLVNWINNYIQQIQSDGTYDEIYTKWFRNNDWVQYLK
jgi:polar amino acid transport system substrate-binding protein